MCTYNSENGVCNSEIGGDNSYGGIYNSENGIYNAEIRTAAINIFLTLQKFSEAPSELTVRGRLNEDYGYYMREKSQPFL